MEGRHALLQVNADSGLLQDRAWSYPTPIPSSFDRVGKDYSGYVAFWKDVRVVD